MGMLCVEKRRGVKKTPNQMVGRVDHRKEGVIITTRSAPRHNLAHLQFLVPAGYAVRCCSHRERQRLLF